MKLKVVYAFVLNNQTHMPGTVIDDSIFKTSPTILAGFLKSGFVKEVGNKPTPQVEEAKKINVPSAVEIKNDQDLKKVVEKEEPKSEPVEEKSEEEVVEEENSSVTKIDSNPKKQKGRLNRN